MGLNEEQLRVVAWRSGTAVVAAGAGSGKTACSTIRAAELVKEGAPPSRVLLLAFNKTAGLELKTRIAKLLGQSLESCTVAAGTFHAWGRGRLMDTYKAAGRPMPEMEEAGYTRMQQVILAKVYASLDSKRQAAMRRELDTSAWLSVSGQAREGLCWLTPESKAADLEKIRALPAFQELELPTIGVGQLDPELVWDIVRAYQDAKKAGNRIDYADMLWMPARLIHDGHRFAQDWRRYDHVTLDEGQDGNAARFLIGDWLGQNAKSYIVVGDLRQSVYSFTGARPDLFVAPLPPPDNANPIGGMGFRELVPGVKVSAKLLTLRTNWRSGEKVVELSNVISQGQSWNLGGSTLAGRAPFTGSVDLRVAGGMEFARLVVDEVMGGGVADEKGKSRCAIIARTRASLLPYRIAARMAKVPVRSLSGEGSIWRSSLAQTIVAYLKVAEGDYSPIKRIAWQPKRFFKADDLQRVQEKAKHDGTDLAVEMQESRDRGLREFGETILELNESTWHKKCDLIRELLITSIEQKTEKATAEDLSASDTVDALCSAASMLGSLAEIEQNAREEEEEAKQQESATELPPALELGTAHIVKGKEYERVWVVAVDKGVFPHPNNQNQAEEHRLFYVACTRAKNHLTVAYQLESAYIATYVKPFVEAGRQPVDPDDLTNDQIEEETQLVEDLRHREAEPDLPGSVAMLDERWASAALQASKDDAKDRGKHHDPSRDHQRKTHALLQLLRPLGFSPAGPGLSSGRLRVWVNDDGDVNIDRDEKNLTSTVGGADVQFRMWTIDNLARAVVEG